LFDINIKRAYAVSQGKSELTKSAEGYVASFLKGEPFPGGFAYREELKRCRLDFTMDSLKRIDALLDQIREKHTPKFETFVESAANQHFLHLTAFYAGKVAGQNVGAEPQWHTREEAIALVPQLKHLWTNDLFETSVICMFRVNGGSQQYPPLLSVCNRLFQGEKSVWGSASGIKLAIAKNTPPPEGMFSKFRRILNNL
jgi:hypothetical protein